MPIIVDRNEARHLVGAGAQLVDVLLEREYAEEHLPGALHLPLKRLDVGSARALLDASRPVIVYCWDALCDMSPWAAWRLERLGFRAVYDYAAGKVDWIAAGPPTVRADTSERRALDAADRDLPTCRPDVDGLVERHDRRRAGQARPRRGGGSKGLGLTSAALPVTGGRSGR